MKLGSPGLPRGRGQAHGARHLGNERFPIHKNPAVEVVLSFLTFFNFFDVFCTLGGVLNFWVRVPHDFRGTPSRGAHKHKTKRIEPRSRDSRVGIQGVPELLNSKRQ